jgi:hypothetical protein
MRPDLEADTEEETEDGAYYRHGNSNNAALGQGI